MKKIIKRVSVWNRWRKSSRKNPIYKLAVLIGIINNPILNFDFAVFDAIQDIEKNKKRREFWTRKHTTLLIIGAIGWLSIISPASPAYAYSEGSTQPFLADLRGVSDPEVIQVDLDEEIVLEDLNISELETYKRIAGMVKTIDDFHEEMEEKRIQYQKELKRKEEEKKARFKKLSDIEQKIAIKCEEYNIPYDIPLAIARLETGWFKSDAFVYGNNPGGLSINEQPIYFNTLDEGIDRFVSNLSNNYFAIGLDTVEEIGQKYCPVNPDWANLVRSVMYSDNK